MTLGFLLMTVGITSLLMATWQGNLVAITENATIDEAPAAIPLSVIPSSGLQCYIYVWIANLYLCLECNFILKSGLNYYTFIHYGYFWCFQN